MTREVIHLADVRQRLEAEREEAVAPIRAAFMEEFGELIYDYIDAVRTATGGDVDKSIQELMATCSTLLALAAEEQFEDTEDRLEFIDSVAEIAADLVAEEDQGDLFGDDPQA